METTFFKYFYSKDKELEWLNKLGNEGYLLQNIKDSKYYFIKNDQHKYSYSIEHLDFSPESEMAAEYYESKKEQGIAPIIYNKNWVYFVKSDGVIEETEAAVKNKEKFYFWKTLYYVFFSLFASFLCGYHIFAINYLKKVPHDGNGAIGDFFEITKMESAILQLLKKIANLFSALLDKYFDIWTDIFGKNDSVAILSVIVPITLVLLVLAGLSCNEFVKYRQRAKAIKPIKTEINTDGNIDEE